MHARCCRVVSAGFFACHLRGCQLVKLIVHEGQQLIDCPDCRTELNSLQNLRDLEGPFRNDSPGILPRLERQRVNDRGERFRGENLEVLTRRLKRFGLFPKMYRCHAL